MNAKQYIYSKNLKLSKLLLVLSVISCQAQAVTLFNFDPGLVRAKNIHLKVGMNSYNMLNVCNDSNQLTGLSAKDVAFHGLCNSIPIRAYAAKLNSSISRHGQAKAMLLPNLGLSATQSLRKTSSFIPDINRPELGVTGDYENQRKDTISFAFPVYTFGATLAAIGSADSHVEAAVYELQEQMESSLVEILVAYYDCYYAFKLYDSFKLGISLAKQSLEITERRYIKGLISKSDVLLAQASVAKYELDMQRMEQQKNSKLNVLSSLLMIESSKLTGMNFSAYEIPEVKISTPIGKDLDEMSALRPLYKAYMMKYKASQLQVEQTKREGFGSINLTSNLSNQNITNKSFQTQKGLEAYIGINMTVPVFEGFGRTYKIKESINNSEVSFQEFENAKKKIKEEIVQNILSLNQELKIQNVVSSYQMIASQSGDAALQKYLKGLSELNDVINAQREYVNSMTEYYSAAFRLAESRIKYNRDGGFLNLELGLDQ